VTAASRCASQLAAQGRDLFLDFEVGELELEGVTNVLAEPEFGMPETLRNLVRFLESPRSIREALQLLDREAGGELGVWIGSENPVGDLREFTVVSHRFPLAGREGILAVLGPRRMPYHRALTGIHTLRDGLRSLTESKTHEQEAERRRAEGRDAEAGHDEPAETADGRRARGRPPPRRGRGETPGPARRAARAARRPADRARRAGRPPLRTAAELDNLRKRSRREVDNARRFAQADVLRPLLDVLDNFERALQYTPGARRRRHAGRGREPGACGRCVPARASS
jgi:hypothetical protein